MSTITCSDRTTLHLFDNLSAQENKAFGGELNLLAFHKPLLSKKMNVRCQGRRYVDYLSNPVHLLHVPALSVNHGTVASASSDADTRLM
jgi:hypothetical protein